MVDQRVGVRWISSDTASERERESETRGLEKERDRLSQPVAGLPQYKVDFSRVSFFNSRLARLLVVVRRGALRSGWSQASATINGLARSRLLGPDKPVRISAEGLQMRVVVSMPVRALQV